VTRKIDDSLKKDVGSETEKKVDRSFKETVEVNQQGKSQRKKSMLNYLTLMWKLC